MRMDSTRQSFQGLFDPTEGDLTSLIDSYSVSSNNHTTSSNSNFTTSQSTSTASQSTSTASQSTSTASQSTSTASQSTSTASQPTVATAVAKRGPGRPSLTIEQKAANKRKRDEDINNNRNHDSSYV
jgi:hypothetical protein